MTVVAVGVPVVTVALAVTGALLVTGALVIGALLVTGALVDGEWDTTAGEPVVGELLDGGGSFVGEDGGGDEGGDEDVGGAGADVEGGAVDVGGASVGSEVVGPEDVGPGGVEAVPSLVPPATLSSTYSPNRSSVPAGGSLAVT